MFDTRHEHRRHQSRVSGVRSLVRQQSRRRQRRIPHPALRHGRIWTDNFPFLPTEVSPFFDAGVSYTNAQGPDFRLTRSANTITAYCHSGVERSERAQQQAYYPCADRIPVFSTGLSFRFNLMGYAIMEAYIAHPFQRPQKNWVWGFQLAPGW